MDLKTQVLEPLLYVGQGLRYCTLPYQHRGEPPQDTVHHVVHFSLLARHMCSRHKCTDIFFWSKESTLGPGNIRLLDV